MLDRRLGNYRPLLELSAGGMATIYLARQAGAAGFERLVVIKRVHRHLLSNRDFCDMFRDEARICSTIHHPHVVPIIDVVEAEGELLLVLEYVESLSLDALRSAVIAAGELLEPAVVARILSDVLSGLHAAHEAVDLQGRRLDLIHRDVSPQNIIVGSDGASRLIDFGIAKAASRISATHSGILKGKLHYMSPEQVRQQPLDRRADLFAAGVVLYEALTGQRLVKGQDEGDIALGLLLGEFPAPSSIVPGIALQLDEVVAKALARSPNERFQTALEFQAALESAVTPAPTRDVADRVQRIAGNDFALRRGVIQGALSQVNAEKAASSQDQRHRRTRAWSAGALFAAAVVGAAVVGATSGRSGRSAPHGSGITQPGASSQAASLATVELTALGSAPSVATAALPPAATPVSAAATQPGGIASAVPAPSGRALRPAGKSRPVTLPPADLHRRNPYGSP